MRLEWVEDEDEDEDEDEVKICLSGRKLNEWPFNKFDRVSTKQTIDDTRIDQTIDQVSMHLSRLRPLFQPFVDRLLTPVVR